MSVPVAPEGAGEGLLVGKPTSPLTGDDRESAGSGAASARLVLAAGIADTAAEPPNESTPNKRP